jgi:hypothetical protein
MDRSALFRGAARLPLNFDVERPPECSQRLLLRTVRSRCAIRRDRGQIEKPMLRLHLCHGNLLQRRRANWSENGMHETVRIGLTTFSTSASCRYLTTLAG